jgi:hypothetical protein
MSSASTPTFSTAIAAQHINIRETQFLTSEGSLISFPWISERYPPPILIEGTFQLETFPLQQPIIER